MTQFQFPSFDESVQYLIKTLGQVTESYSVTNESLTLNLKVDDLEKTFYMTREEIETGDNLIKDYKKSSIVLYSEKSYEVLVTRVSHTFNRHLYEEISVKEENEEYCYLMSTMSLEFFWFYFANMVGGELVVYQLSTLSRYDFEYDEPNNTSIIQFLRSKLGHSTVKISTTRKLSPQKFEELVTSFSYILAYNISGSFRISSDHFKTSEESLALPNRTSDISLISPPKMKYEPNLVGYYTRMMSSSDVSSQFLSLYHILEHEFDKVVTEDTIKYVSQKIRSTAFSSKNPTDIETLIREISKRVKVSPDNEDEITAGKELNALRLVINRHLKSKTEISNLLGREWVKYYSDMDVQFCSAKKIDMSKSEDDIAVEIAQRIYSIRNSIVHSKSGNSNRFVPFRDDEILSKEIPLIKVLAEQIIEFTAEEI